MRSLSPIRDMVGRLRAWLRDKTAYRPLSLRSRRPAAPADRQARRGLFGISRPLVIPAFEGQAQRSVRVQDAASRGLQDRSLRTHGDVGLATAAAPSYFRPLEHRGYTLVDGGVWANNPIMLAVIEALICFDLGRDQIDVFSLGCGDDRYVVSRRDHERRPVALEENHGGGDASSIAGGDQPGAALARATVGDAFGCADIRAPAPHGRLAPIGRQTRALSCQTSTGVKGHEIAAKFLKDFGRALRSDPSTGG